MKRNALRAQESNPPFLFLLIAGGHLSSYFYTAKQLIVKKKDHLGDESNVDWHVFLYYVIANQRIHLFQMLFY